MEHKIILMILILGVAIFSGCVDNPGKTVYLNKATNHTVTLYSDKTFAYVEDDGTFSGTYRIDGDHVILTFAMFGQVLDLTKNGNNLTYPQDGTVWEKE